MYQGEANDDNGAFHGRKVGKSVGKNKDSVYPKFTYLLW
jgi:hypothetical protein